MWLQIWRRMLNSERVGLILRFFIPALWQDQQRQPTLFSTFLWDGCEIYSTCPALRTWRWLWVASVRPSP
jgi:hypothetical protein